MIFQNFYLIKKICTQILKKDWFNRLSHLPSGTKEKRKTMPKKRRVSAFCLEAFAMNDGRTRFVILLLGDPHLREKKEEETEIDE